MDEIKIKCPHCSEQTSVVKFCQACQNDLRPIIALQNMALEHYNRTINMIAIEEMDKAWEEISKSIKIFPYSSDVLQLAWRLSRELGYYKDANRIMVAAKRFLSQDEFNAALLLLSQEIQLYNDLLKDDNAKVEGVDELMIHRRLRELGVHKPMDGLQTEEITKPKLLRLLVPLSASLIVIMGALNVWQRVDYNSRRETFVSQIKGLEQRMNTKQPPVVIETGSKGAAEPAEQPFQILPDSPKERERLLRSLWGQKKYDELSKYDSESWFVRSSKYLQLWNKYHQSTGNFETSAKALTDLDNWTIQNDDFPSYYGDLCLALLDIYSEGPHRNEDKEKQIAHRLVNWVKSMPQTAEYTQYLNTKVMRSING